MEQTTRLDAVHAAIRQVQAFLTPYLSLANTHGADFLSDNHWVNYLSEATQSSMLNLSSEDLVNLSLLTMLEKCRETPTSSCSRATDHEVKDLRSFIAQAQQCHLDRLDVLTPLDVMLQDRLLTQDPTSVISEAMSEKKHHEVGIMVDTVSALYKSTQSDLVVDIGSGKGYFASELSLKHKVPVIGFDSNDTNTHGASKRDKRLAKKWMGLERKTRKKQGKVNSSLKTEDGQIAEDNCKDLLQNAELQWDAVLDTLIPESNSTDLGNQPNNDSSCHSESISSVCVCKESQPKVLIEKSKLSECEQISTCDLYKPVTLYVHPGMDLCKVIHQEVPHHRSISSPRIFLTGLHTCGSLAVTTANLFLQDPHAVGLCCVGCCYQLMEECSQDQFIKNDDNECKNDTLQGCHFPISHCGKKLGLQLGRNARNLASQSVHRIRASGQLQGGDFLWRALLNVLLIELGIAVPERIIGMRGLNKKSTTFHDYAVGAFKKLGISDCLPDAHKLKDLEMRHSDARAKMSAFFQLKLVLAPVIETLILLDRLAFLLEQETVCTAHLVQLFDPVLSPRCYALIAWKEREKSGSSQ